MAEAFLGATVKNAVISVPGACPCAGCGVKAFRWIQFCQRPAQTSLLFG